MFAARQRAKLNQKRRVNNVDDISSEAATIGKRATAEEQMNQTDSLIQQHNIYDANYDLDYDNFDDNCVAVISDTDSLRNVEPVNMQIQFRNTETKALVDSGSACTINNKSFAKAVVMHCKESYWIQTQDLQDLKPFSNELIKTIGVINTTVKCTDCIAPNVNVTLVEDCHRSIIGRYCLFATWTCPISVKTNTMLTKTNA